MGRTAESQEVGTERATKGVPRGCVQRSGCLGKGYRGGVHAGGAGRVLWVPRDWNPEVGDVHLGMGYPRMEYQACVHADGYLRVGAGFGCLETGT